MNEATTDDPSTETATNVGLAREGTPQQQGRAQINALVALADSVRTCGLLRYATTEQLNGVMSKTSGLMAHASQLLEVRRQQSANGRASAGRGVTG